MATRLISAALGESSMTVQHRHFISFGDNFITNNASLNSIHSIP